ncbi:hydrogenase nickel incorporation protein HypB [Lachnospira multipara]|uniref:Hydrogenase nickel incorporation protein HypB n=1 Tax=Lachnospira multipara TaxID=28051 RepID=A0A1H5UG32_9FIRM|nr:hydrogenase nickel incorporation protein HypB [Lachnospira multipara]SEF73990.1 Hydrogenase nickel incorporation protein HypB [Lachnospira multipara]
MSSIKVMDVKAEIISDNDKEAAALREEVRKNKVFFVNLMASPGAGKTTTLVRTINALKRKYRIGVMEADVDSLVDAKTIEETGAKVVQLHTGGACHMDVAMTKSGLDLLDCKDLDLVFLENVGNLVCPAEFDVGANKRVMILSVPEGDDKALKYPLMFEVSDLLLVNKIDCLEVFDFNFDALKENVSKLNKNLEIIPVSSLTGEGFDKWIDWLDKEVDSFLKDARKDR